MFEKSWGQTILVNVRDSYFRSLVKYTGYMSRVNSIIGTNIGTTIGTNFIEWNWFCYSMKHVKTFALALTRDRL